MSAAHTSSKLIRIVAGLITDSNGRVLLVRKQGTSFFMQPGGKIEPNETLVETLIREILEELGCAVQHESIQHKGRFVAKAANEPEHEVDADVYALEIIGEPLAKAEIEELVWMPPDNPDGLRLAPLSKDHVIPLV